MQPEMMGPMDAMPMDGAMPMDATAAPDFPAIHVPEPFSLETCDQIALEKIRDEVMDKVHTWENSMTKFFGEYHEFAQSWRVQPRDSGSKKPKGLFNSKSGETHRGTETLATLWFRMLTASDSFFEAVPKGLDPLGRELTPNDLYAVEKVLTTQLRTLRFKEKLGRSLRSLALFGTTIYEEPWVVRANADGTAYYEGTDFQHRSLLTTGFDTTVYDMDMSDYIFTVDYPTIWRLREWASSSPEVWDKSRIMAHLADTEYAEGNGSVKRGTSVYDRVQERRQRAGYTVTDKNIKELITYHGKLDAENPVVQQYWESMGYQDKPEDCDYTVAIIDGEPVVRFHATQYKTWRSKFKTAHFKLFELEPLGYGVGKIGKKHQRELDVTDSRANDILMFALYSMWKVGRFAGLKANQLNIKPWNIVELEDISQLEPLRPDIQAIVQALAMQASKKEDFRATTGAVSTLQATPTKANSATESVLLQNEGIRGGGVHAEIIGETLIREHLEQMHVNNLDNLDAEIWVAITGEQRPRYYNKNNLPRNVGFEIRITTDKNFRPERAKSILEALQMATSIRNVIPNALNVVQPLFEEWFRTLDLNPRLMQRPIPIADQLIDGLRRQQKMGQMPEMGAEANGDPSGGGSNLSTPMGPVESSPIGPMPDGSAM